MSDEGDIPEDEVDALADYHARLRAHAGSPAEVKLGIYTRTKRNLGRSAARVALMLFEANVPQNVIVQNYPGVSTVHQNNNPGGWNVSVSARDIVLYKQALDQSTALAIDLKRVLARARDEIEQAALSSEDKGEVADELGKLTGELAKPNPEPSRVARYLSHIRDVVPAVEQILTTIECILTGKQMEALRDALCDAFDPDAFDQMLRFRLERIRVQLAADGGFRTVVFKVIDVAHREGWVPNLVGAARDSNPGNTALQKFCAEYPHLVARTSAK
jgi:hypothetical protein